MNETIEYLAMFARFPFALHRFLQHHLTLDEARAIIRQRMAQRVDNFLRVAERSIYGYPRSPYLPLLKMAGCELGDLQALVRQKGLEDALRDLRGAGVYITFEEFKGRKPIERNGQTMATQPKDWDNPAVRPLYTTETGSSSGMATQVSHDLERVAGQGANRLVSYSAWGVYGAPVVYWRGILPDSTLSGILQDIYIGSPPYRWFSNQGLRDSKHWLKYGLATYYNITWSRLLGAHVPYPAYVTAERPEVVACYLAALLAAQGRCLLRTSVSRALRVCLAAQESGINLSGLTISAGGEPVTPAKASGIQQTGAHLLANYAVAEAGSLGYGCATATEENDIHLFKDAVALITSPHEVASTGTTVPAFNVTTLLPSASKIMLNLQMGDYGVVEEHDCGCELGSYGYTTHLRRIRSYSKLVGEGVTLIGNDIVCVLEDVLPARFGGTALDYQLLEEEDGQGFTRLLLVIDPAVPVANEQEVIAVVMDALRRSSSMADAARSQWQRAGTLQIRRMKPILTARGKLSPLYHLRSTPRQ